MADDEQGFDEHGFDDPTAALVKMRQEMKELRKELERTKDDLKQARKQADDNKGQLQWLTGGSLRALIRDEMHMEIPDEFFELREAQDGSKKYDNIVRIATQLNGGRAYIGKNFPDGTHLGQVWWWDGSAWELSEAAAVIPPAILVFDTANGPPRWQNIEETYQSAFRQPSGTMDSDWPRFHG